MAVNPILVINPNSSERITDQIRAAVAGAGASVEVVTSTEGPAAIESDADVAAAVTPMLAVAAASTGAAYVVACFSDPGLDELRAATSTPAFGIAESAIAAARQLGDGIGVISSVADSLPRHERYWRKLGVAHRVVADVAVGLGVLELDTPGAYTRALAAGRELIASGADVIVLGCTGMTHMADRLGAELGVPVIDPCRAAVDAARRHLEEAN